MTALANGLGVSFVVEGAETADILDALIVLGAGAAQDNAVARPMSADVLVGWLSNHRNEPASRQPRSLHGVYASHLGVVRACSTLRTQPL